jgi:adenylate cyclase
MFPYVHLLVAWCAYVSGDLIKASSELNGLMEGLVSARPRAVAGFTPLDPWASAPWMFAMVQQALGRPDEALKLCDKALSRARQLKSSFSLGAALLLAGVVRYERRAPEAVRELSEALSALAEEHGFGERLAQGHLLRGWAVTELGQIEQGASELEAGAASIPVLMETLLPQVYMRLGHADQAVVMLDEKLARFERSGAHLQEPELHRLKGEAILMRDSSATAAAETCFRKAIEIAGGQSAKWWELRATVSLARLLVKQDRRDEARAMVSEIYGWFTEGFDTADLKEARALLDELGV